MLLMLKLFSKKLSLSSWKANISNKNEDIEMNQKAIDREKIHFDDKVVFELLTSLNYATGCFKLSLKCQQMRTNIFNLKKCLKSLII